MTLEEFLTARYAESQAAAHQVHKAHQERIWGHANIPGTNQDHLPWKRKEDIGYEPGTLSSLVAARANTRMVEIHSGDHECPGNASGNACQTLRLLAAPYAAWVTHRDRRFRPADWVADWQPAWVDDTPGQAAD